MMVLILVVALQHGTEGVCKLTVHLGCMYQVELLQVGPRGDLVVGSYELAVAALVAKGTIVHWFELRSAARTVGAELCMVLRYGTSEWHDSDGCSAQTLLQT